MRKETKVFEIYKFSELSKGAKEKAIKRFSDINVDFEEWSDYTIENYTNKLNELGYDDVKCYFSGFWSQGDGACFTAVVNLYKWGKKHKISTKLIEKGDMTAKITHNFRYYYAKSTNVEVYVNGESNDKIEALRDKIESIIEKEREEIGNELYKELRDQYNYLTSEEAIVETIKANDYEFLASGELY